MSSLYTAGMSPVGRASDWLPSANTTRITNTSNSIIGTQDTRRTTSRPHHGSQSFRDQPARTESGGAIAVVDTVARIEHIERRLLQCREHVTRASASDNEIDHNSSIHTSRQVNRSQQYGGNNMSAVSSASFSGTSAAGYNAAGDSRYYAGINASPAGTNRTRQPNVGFSADVGNYAAAAADVSHASRASNASSAGATSVLGKLEGLVARLESAAAVAGNTSRVQQPNPPPATVASTTANTSAAESSASIRTYDKATSRVRDQLTSYGGGYYGTSVAASGGYDGLVITRHDTSHRSHHHHHSGSLPPAQAAAWSHYERFGEMLLQQSFAAKNSLLLETEGVGLQRARRNVGRRHRSKKHSSSSSSSSSVSTSSTSSSGNDRRRMRHSSKKSKGSSKKHYREERRRSPSVNRRDSRTASPDNYYIDDGRNNDTTKYDGPAVVGSSVGYAAAISPVRRNGTSPVSGKRKISPARPPRSTVASPLAAADRVMAAENNSVVQYRLDKLLHDQQGLLRRLEGQNPALQRLISLETERLRALRELERERERAAMAAERQVHEERMRMERELLEAEGRLRREYESQPRGRSQSREAGVHADMSATAAGNNTAGMVGNNTTPATGIVVEAGAGMEESVASPTVLTETRRKDVSPPRRPLSPQQMTMLMHRVAVVVAEEQQPLMGKTSGDGRVISPARAGASHVYHTPPRRAAAPADGPRTASVAAGGVSSPSVEVAKWALREGISGTAANGGAPANSASRDLQTSPQRGARPPGSSPRQLGSYPQHTSPERRADAVGAQTLMHESPRKLDGISEEVAMSVADEPLRRNLHADDEEEEDAHHHDSHAKGHSPQRVVEKRRGSISEALGAGVLFGERESPSGRASDSGTHQRKDATSATAAPANNEEALKQAYEAKALALSLTFAQTQAEERAKWAAKAEEEAARRAERDQKTIDVLLERQLQQQARYEEVLLAAAASKVANTNVGGDNGKGVEGSTTTQSLIQSHQSPTRAGPIASISHALATPSGASHPLSPLSHRSFGDHGAHHAVDSRHISPYRGRGDERSGVETARRSSVNATASIVLPADHSTAGRSAADGGHPTSSPSRARAHHNPPVNAQSSASTDAAKMALELATAASAPLLNTTNALHTNYAQLLTQSQQMLLQQQEWAQKQREAQHEHQLASQKAQLETLQQTLSQAASASASVAAAAAAIAATGAASGGSGGCRGGGGSDNAGDSSTNHRRRANSPDTPRGGGGDDRIGINDSRVGSEGGHLPPSSRTQTPTPNQSISGTGSQPYAHQPAHAALPHPPPLSASTINRGPATPYLDAQQHPLGAPPASQYPHATTQQVGSSDNNHHSAPYLSPEEIERSVVAIVELKLRERLGDATGGGSNLTSPAVNSSMGRNGTAVGSVGIGSSSPLVAAAEAEARDIHLAALRASTIEVQQAAALLRATTERSAADNEANHRRRTADAKLDDHLAAQQREQIALEEHLAAHKRRYEEQLAAVMAAQREQKAALADALHKHDVQRQAEEQRKRRHREREMILLKELQAERERAQQLASLQRERAAERGQQQQQAMIPSDLTHQKHRDDSVRGLMKTVMSKSQDDGGGGSRGAGSKSPAKQRRTSSASATESSPIKGIRDRSVTASPPRHPNRGHANTSIATTTGGGAASPLSTLFPVKGRDAASSVGAPLGAAQGAGSSTTSTTSGAGRVGTPTASSTVPTTTSIPTNSSNIYYNEREEVLRQQLLEMRKLNASQEARWVAGKNYPNAAAEPSDVSPRRRRSSSFRIMDGDANGGAPQSPKQTHKSARNSNSHHVNESLMTSSQVGGVTETPATLRPTTTAAAHTTASNVTLTAASSAAKRRANSSAFGGAGGSLNASVNNHDTSTVASTSRSASREAKAAINWVAVCSRNPSIVSAVAAAQQSSVAASDTDNKRHKESIILNNSVSVVGGGGGDGGVSPRTNRTSSRHQMERESASTKNRHNTSTSHHHHRQQQSGEESPQKSKQQPPFRCGSPQTRPDEGIGAAGGRSSSSLHMHHQHQHNRKRSSDEEAIEAQRKHRAPSRHEREQHGRSPDRNESNTTTRHQHRSNRADNSHHNGGSSPPRTDTEARHADAHRIADKLVDEFKAQHDMAMSRSRSNGDRGKGGTDGRAPTQRAPNGSAPTTESAASTSEAGYWSSEASTSFAVHHEHNNTAASRRDIGRPPTSPLRHHAAKPTAPSTSSSSAPLPRDAHHSQYNPPHALSPIPAQRRELDISLQSPTRRRGRDDAHRSDDNDTNGKEPPQSAFAGLVSTTNTYPNVGSGGVGGSRSNRYDHPQAGSTSSSSYYYDGPSSSAANEASRLATGGGAAKDSGIISSYADAFRNVSPQRSGKHHYYGSAAGYHHQSRDASSRPSSTAPSSSAARPQSPSTASAVKNQRGSRPTSATRPPPVGKPGNFYATEMVTPTDSAEVPHPTYFASATIAATPSYQQPTTSFLEHASLKYQVEYLTLSKIADIEAETYEQRVAEEAGHRRAVLFPQQQKGGGSDATTNGRPHSSSSIVTGAAISKQQARALGLGGMGNASDDISPPRPNSPTARNYDVMDATLLAMAVKLAEGGGDTNDKGGKKRSAGGRNTSTSPSSRRQSIGYGSAAAVVMGLSSIHQPRNGGNGANAHSPSRGQHHQSPYKHRTCEDPVCHELGLR